MMEFADEESVKTILAAYNKFGAEISRAAYEGSGIVRTAANAAFVMATEVPWEQVPADVKRAWMRSGMAASQIYTKHHKDLLDALHSLKRKDAEKRGELPYGIYFTDPQLEGPKE